MRDGEGAASGKRGGASGRSRRRGVRASRAKLASALASAGLRTQSALADRIADLESLEVPPRGIVYRVFRQQPVDLRTLSRVARALDVDVQSLLLSPEEPVVTDAPTGTREGDDHRRPRRRLAGVAVAVAVGVLVLALAIVLWMAAEHAVAPPGGDAAGMTSAGGLSTLTVAVLRFPGDPADRLAEALRRKLSRLALAVPVNLMDVDTGGDAATIAAQTGADVVVDGGVIARGRHAAVRLGAWIDGTRRVFWAAHARRRALAEHADEFANAAVAALRRAMSPGPHPGPLPPAAAQEHVVRGQHHLDQSRTELNVRRAINRFEAALRSHAEYPAASAGLCRALVRESLINSDPSVLPDAERACARAAELAPDLPVVRIARGRLARRTGQLDEARRHFQAVLEADPGHVDAMLALAEVSLAAFRAGDLAAREPALAYARRATEAEPDFWKPPFVLAQIHFLAGDVDAAIASGERAVSLDPNGHALADLGTSHLCRGDRRQALEYYLRARDAAPGASVGQAKLCIARYYQRQFDQAVQTCRAAVEIDSSGGEAAHALWGYLADAYRQAGRLEQSVDAYGRAVQLAERELLVGGRLQHHRADLAYYHAALMSLDAARVRPRIVERLPRELAASARSIVDPRAMLRIASAWALLGRLANARDAYTAGTQRCPGFAVPPDLDVLQTAADASAGAGG